MIRYLCPIFTFCGTPKQEELLGENCKDLKILATLRRRRISKITP
jgi:hypothetical protein